MIENDNRPEVRKYVHMQVLNLDRCDVAYVRQWIIDVMKIWKIATVEKNNDIRRYFDRVGN